MKTFDEAVDEVFTIKGSHELDKARNLQMAFADEAVNNQLLSSLFERYWESVEERAADMQMAENGESPETCDRITKMFIGAITSVFLWGVATGREMEKVLPFDAAPSPVPVPASVADASGDSRDSGDFGSADFFSTLQELKKEFPDYDVDIFKVEITSENE